MLRITVLNPITTFNHDGIVTVSGNPDKNGGRGYQHFPPEEHEEALRQWNSGEWGAWPHFDRSINDSHLEWDYDWEHQWEDYTYEPNPDPSSFF